MNEFFWNSAIVILAAIGFFSIAGSVMLFFLAVFGKDIEPGLTKLELISAMCLQAMLSNKDYTERHDYDFMCEISITSAKELLKQLSQQ